MLCAHDDEEGSFYGGGGGDDSDGDQEPSAGGMQGACVMSVLYALVLCAHVMRRASAMVAAVVVMTAMTDRSQAQEACKVCMFFVCEL